MALRTLLAQQRAQTFQGTLACQLARPGKCTIPADCAALCVQVAERAWHSGPCGDEALRALLTQLHALLALLLGPLQRLLDQVRKHPWL